MTPLGPACKLFICLMNRSAWVNTKTPLVLFGTRFILSKELKKHSSVRAHVSGKGVVLKTTDNHATELKPAQTVIPSSLIIQQGMNTKLNLNGICEALLRFVMYVKKSVRRSVKMKIQFSCCKPFERLQLVVPVQELSGLEEREDSREEGKPAERAREGLRSDGDSETPL